MKLITIDNIPHWEDAGVRLPIVAGGDHIPGHIGTTIADTEGDFLSQFAGQTVFTQEGQAFEVRAVPSGSITTYRLFPIGGGQQLSGSQMRGLTFVDNLGIGHTIGTVSGGDYPLQSRTLSESALARFFGVGTGTTGTAPSFASTQAAQTQQEAFRREQAQRDAAIAAQAATLLSQRQAEQDKLDREFREEQNRLAEEAALKRGRLSTLTDLIQSFVGAQSQARETLANLQPDPFKFAAVAGGVAPFGVTPQQGFTEQLQQFAGAPVPTADPNASLPSIESAIQGLTGANVPLAPQVFGAAGGATIPAPALGQSVVVKVGEKRPDGGSEEILRITAQGVEVIPIMAGAQEGGFFPFKPIEFDAETLLPALGRTGIFEGFSQFPRVSLGERRGGLAPRAQGFFARPGSKRSFRNLDLLGVQPGLVRFGEDPTVFFRGSEGTLRPFTSAEQFTGAGFDFGNVVRIDPQSRAGFDFGPALEQGFEVPVPTERPSAFTKFSVPLIEPTTGTILPNPAVVASQLNRLRLTDPATFNLLLNAYESAVTPAGNSAGFGAQSVLATIQAALPFGQARTNIGLN